MYITKLMPTHFGKLKNVEISLKPGINIIYGRNESGKSTLHSFIKSMWYGIDKARGRASKEDFYTKYQPISTPGEYEGGMDFCCHGKEYRVFRRFYQREKSSKLYEVSAARERKDWCGTINDLIPGLTEGIFKNTISIRQLHGKTGLELADAMQTYLANLSTTKESEIDLAAAMEFLNKQKKRILMIDYHEKKKICEQELHELKNKDISAEENEKLIGMLSERKKLLEQEFLSLEQKLYQPFMKLAMKYLDFKEKQEEMAKLEYSKSIMKYIRKRKLHALISLLLCIALGAGTLWIVEMPAIYRWFSGSLCIVSGLSFLWHSMVQKLRSKEAEVRKREFVKLEKELQEYKRQLISYYDDSRTSDSKAVVKQADSRCLNHACEMNQKSENKAIGKRQGILPCVRKKREDTSSYLDNAHRLIQKEMDEIEQLLEEKGSEYTRARENYHQKRDDLLLQIDRLTQQQLNAKDSFYELQQKIKEIKEIDRQIMKQKEEVDAILLSAEVIKNLSQEIHDSFGATLIQRISDKLCKITTGKYTELMLDENFSVQVKLNNQYLPMHQLSVGTVDQIYLAIRLSVTEVLFPQESLPILCDDAFCYYDDERLEQTLEMLAKQKTDQLIIFTCQHREDNYYDKAGIPFHYVELEEAY